MQEHMCVCLSVRVCLCMRTFTNDNPCCFGCWLPLSVSVRVFTYVCMQERGCMYLCVCMCVSVCIALRVYVCFCVCVLQSWWLYVLVASLGKCACVYVGVHARAWVYVSLCMYLCLWVCVYQSLMS